MNTKTLVDGREVYMFSSELYINRGKRGCVNTKTLVVGQDVYMFSSEIYVNRGKVVGVTPSGVAAGEAVLIHQVLVDRYSVAASAESQFDGFSVWIASAGAGTALWRRHWRRGKSAHFVWLGWVEVGDHLIGRF